MSDPEGLCELREGERLDDLIGDSLRVIQKEAGFRFSTDAVLLANFATVKRGDRVLDLGTGTGVIPLLLAAKTPAAEIHGLELQADLADMASRSVAYNALSGRVFVRHGDLREAASIYGHGVFNLVVCNPPFTTPGTGFQSPVHEVALSRHELTCTLEDVIVAFEKLVRYGGRVALVHRPARLTDILCLLREHRLEPKRLRFVQPRDGQSPNMVLVEAIRGAGKQLEVLPPLVIYEAAGTYTKELRGLYYGEGVPSV